MGERKKGKKRKEKEKAEIIMLAKGGWNFANQASRYRQRDLAREQKGKSRHFTKRRRKEKKRKEAGKEKEELKKQTQY